MQHAVITGAPHNTNHRTDMRVQTHLITECEAIRTGNNPKDCFLYEKATCQNRCRFLKFDEYCDYV